MTGYVCSNTGATSPFGPPDPDMPCCWESANNPDRCSCWMPVYVDSDLTGDPVLVTRSMDLQEGPPAIRHAACGDCAYRPGSPERADNDGEIPGYGTNQRFYCHDGMACIVGWWHPEAGVARVNPVPKGDYDPVLRGDRAWMADGRPALLCGGWGAANQLPRMRRPQTAIVADTERNT